MREHESHCRCTAEERRVVADLHSLRQKLDVLKNYLIHSVPYRHLTKEIVDILDEIEDSGV